MTAVDGSHETFCIVIILTESVITLFTLSFSYKYVFLNMQQSVCIVFNI